MASQVQEQRPQQQQPKMAPPAIDPFESPIEYAKANGFQPLGNPDWPQTRWVDTTKPLFGEEHFEDCRAHFLRRNEQTGKVEAVLEQVFANDGTGKQKPVRQLVYTPPAVKFTLQEVLEILMEREHRKQVEARKKAKVA